jgi:hypothetical protein
VREQNPSVVRGEQARERRRHAAQGGVAFDVCAQVPVGGADHDGELPEDILTSDIDDGDPELGEFSPWSWWPIVLAGSAGIFVVGLAVGHFLLPIGLAVFVVAIVGWVYEYYRGNFAR